jgi:two-component system phosphate regulon response regulator PhoB
LLGGQRPESRLHGRERFSIAGKLGEVWPRRDGFGPGHLVIIGRIQRKLRPALARSKLIEGAVGRDPKEPGAERDALERSDGSPRREERVLNDILGIRCRADDAERMPIERSLLSSREIFERSRVTRTRAVDEKLDLAFWASAQCALVASNRLKSVPDRVEDRKKKVVVIGEDDEPIALLLRDAISDEPGYQAVVVADGALVLDTVRQVHADLLILDIMMPGLNGLEVYDRVRDDSGIRDMAVLFVSANLPQFDREFRQRKITSVLTKPFDLNELLDRVRELCPG